MATAGATKVKGVDAGYYMVRNLDRATKFYNDFLGMEPTLVVPGSVSEYTFAGGESFGLYQPAQEGEYSSSHGMLFAVDDINAAVADYKSRGIQFEDDGKIDESPVCFMAFAQDSEGNRFIVHQRKKI
jgi:predicted enzyme related to lactoylglutathione lyase